MSPERLIAPEKTTTHRDLAIIVGSAGSFEPLREIIAGLGGYTGTVLVVVHVPAHTPSGLPALLSHAGTLPVRHAKDEEPLPRGAVLVAPPNRHLVVEGGRVRLGFGPHENGARPSADPLFRTAARAHGPRVVGVVLSGALDDGTRGLAVVKKCGGVAIVQRPSEARFSGMPASALENVAVDHVLPARDIAPRLRELAGLPVKCTPGESVGRAARPPEVEGNPRDLAHDGGASERKATLLSCPGCHGVLMRLAQPGPLHFSCQIGHAYSPRALASAEAEDTQTGLDAAHRSLRERAVLNSMMAEMARARNDHSRADKLAERARRLETSAKQVQALYEALARANEDFSSDVGDDENDEKSASTNA